MNKFNQAGGFGIIFQTHYFDIQSNNCSMSEEGPSFLFKIISHKTSKNCSSLLTIYKYNILHIYFTSISPEYYQMSQSPSLPLVHYSSHCETARNNFLVKPNYTLPVLVKSKQLKNQSNSERYFINSFQMNVNNTIRCKKKRQN